MSVRKVVCLALAVAAGIGTSGTTLADTATCSPPPRIIKLGIPRPPTNVQWYNLPDRVGVKVEFTVGTDGRASSVVVLDSTAGHFLQEFSAQAIKAVDGLRFEPVEQPCRTQITIGFSRP
jgi:TonB family protein